MSGKPGGLAAFMQKSLAEKPVKQKPAEQKLAIVPKSTKTQNEKSRSEQKKIKPVTSKSTELQTTKLTDSVSLVATEEFTHYEDYERKECRFRPDQFEALMMLERRLSRIHRKRAGQQRITANTLIRVAVDLFLEHSSELQGADEVELLDEIRGRTQKKR